MAALLSKQTLRQAALVFSERVVEPECFVLAAGILLRYLADEIQSRKFVSCRCFRHRRTSTIKIVYAILPMYVHKYRYKYVSVYLKVSSCDATEYMPMLPAASGLRLSENSLRQTIACPPRNIQYWIHLCQCICDIRVYIRLFLHE